jgi:hypothetical protein
MQHEEDKQTSDGTMTITVQEVEPGWTLLSFQKPPRLAKTRFHALLQFVEGWRTSNPTRRIEAVVPCEHNSLVRGVNIYWSIFEHLVPALSNYKFVVDPDIRDRYGHEYCEAIVSEASGFLASFATMKRNAVLVSKRRVAAVFARDKNEVEVVWFEQFLQSIDSVLATEISQQFDDWLEANKESHGYYGKEY